MVYAHVITMQTNTRESTLSPASSLTAAMLTINPRIMHCFFPSTDISRLQSELSDCRITEGEGKLVTMGGGIGFELVVDVESDGASSADASSDEPGAASTSALSAGTSWDSEWCNLS